MQIFANGKQRFHSFIEFFVIHLKKSRGKNLISGTLIKSHINARVLSQFCQFALE